MLVISDICFGVPQMHCKFLVYNVPWEKRKELLDHECVGLKERVLSCERSKPVKAPEPDQNNIVQEMFDKVWSAGLQKIGKSLFSSF